MGKRRFLRNRLFRKATILEPFFQSILASFWHHFCYFWVLFLVSFFNVDFASVLATFRGGKNRGLVAFWRQKREKIVVGKVAPRSVKIIWR